jgi:hypothetical protein
MPASSVAAAFEHIEEAREIGIDIGVGIDQGMSHAGLRSEMHDGGKTIRRKQLRHELAFGKVRPDEFEIRGCLELRDPGLFQMGIVISIEVVEADHLIAVRQQPPRDMHADKPGRSGDKHRLLQLRSFPATGDVSRLSEPSCAIGARLMAFGAV